MSETASHHTEHQNYHLEYDKNPDWQDVTERLAQLAIPVDPRDRVADVRRNFSRGADLEALAMAMHQVLVPDTRTAPTHRSAEMVGPNGEVRTTLAQPQERQRIYDFAGTQLEALGAMYQPGQETEFLERAANVIALSVVLTHSFKDGNGRTARLLGDLIRNGPESEDLRLAGTNRPTTGARIPSYVPRKNIDMSPYEIIAHAAQPDTPLADHDEYTKRREVVFSTPYTG